MVKIAGKKITDQTISKQVYNGINTGIFIKYADKKQERYKGKKNKSKKKIRTNKISQKM